MRVLLKISVFLAGTVVLVLAVGFSWLYFYNRDLPDVNAMAQYAPTTVAQTSDTCLGESIAIPYEAIGANVRNAISAAEVREEDPGVLTSEFLEPCKLHRGTLPTAISRTICYAPSRSLTRQVAELRTAIQLERRYSRRQLFTIFANRSYFGPEQTGIYKASEFYFHKKPNDLSMAEAAMLAGLLRSPTAFSPFKHPDRALRRRNEVLDAMVENSSITAAEAEAAKASPLGVVADVTTTQR